MKIQSVTRILALNIRNEYLSRSAIVVVPVLTGWIVQFSKYLINLQPLSPYYYLLPVSRILSYELSYLVINPTFFDYLTELW